MIDVEQELILTKTLFAKKYYLKNLLEKLNNIQNQIKTINVVGTNGKGSTSYYLMQGLMKKYQKVGLFISPAFCFHNERISINGQYISDEKLKAILEKYKLEIEEYQLTFFEIWTLIMIDYFVEQKVDIAVIEAGVGGLFDTTNLFNNQIAVVLTSLSLDHEILFKNDINTIIEQKAKIAKNNSKIYTTFSNEKYLEKIKGYVNNQVLVTKQPVDFEIGDYKTENLLLANMVLKDLNLEQLNKVKDLPGRFQVLKKDPYIIIDGAHNEDAFRKLAQKISKYNQDFIFLVALTNEKKVEHVKKYFPRNLYFANFEHPNAIRLDVSNIINDWKDFLCNIKDKNILIFGSLYFIPQVFKYLSEIGVVSNE